MKTTVYAWFFEHGKQEERTKESVEAYLNEYPQVTSIDHIRAMENHLGKDYINPKITNFVALRKIEVK